MAEDARNYPTRCAASSTRVTMAALIGGDKEGQAAGNASGRVADFHALRHTFIPRLARSGVAPAVAKSLERIADLGTNIAEHVIFMVTGEIVRHKPKA